MVLTTKFGYGTEAGFSSMYMYQLQAAFELLQQGHASAIPAVAHMFKVQDANSGDFNVWALIRIACLAKTNIRSTCSLLRQCCSSDPALPIQASSTCWHACRAELVSKSKAAANGRRDRINGAAAKVGSDCDVAGQVATWLKAWLNSAVAGAALALQMGSIGEASKRFHLQLNTYS